MSGFEGVIGAVAAIPALIDTCIEYGKFIEKKVQLFRSAEKHSRLYGFILNLCTGSINEMLLFSKVFTPNSTRVFN